MKAQLNSRDFDRAISATKAFASTDPARPIRQYIRLEFNAAESTMTAMAVNGYIMSVEHVPCTCDGDFTSHIHPRILLPDGDPTTIIEVTDRDTLIRRGGTIFGSPRIAGEDPFDWRNAISQTEPDYKIAVNPNYLLSALRAAAVSVKKPPRSPIILEYRGPLEPLVLRTNKDDIKLVMPVRSKETQKEG